MYPVKSKALNDLFLNPMIPKGESDAQQLVGAKSLKLSKHSPLQ